MKHVVMLVVVFFVACSSPKSDFSQVERPVVVPKVTVEFTNLTEDTITVRCKSYEGPLPEALQSITLVPNQFFSVQVDSFAAGMRVRAETENGIVYTGMRDGEDSYYGIAYKLFDSDKVSMTFGSNAVRRAEFELGDSIEYVYPYKEGVKYPEDMHVGIEGGVGVIWDKHNAQLCIGRYGHARIVVVQGRKSEVRQMYENLAHYFSTRPEIQFEARELAWLKRELEERRMM